jgi:hypothetical protein
MFVCLMVFNATFNNIAVVWWRSILLRTETGGPEENNRPVASHRHSLSHNVVHLALIENLSLVNGDHLMFPIELNFWGNIDIPSDKSI